MTRTVPLADPRRLLSGGLARKLLSAIEQIAARDEFVQGEIVSRFEQELATATGRRFSVGVGCGTDAVALALSALDLKPGDEVVTTGYVCAAVIGAILRTGATPCLVDIDPATMTMDPRLLGQAITERTRAVVPVHLFGVPAHLDAIVELAAARDIPVVEAAAPAIGARSRGRPAGSVGIAGCFSFHPRKTLGAWGEAGAVVTDDEEIAARVRALRDHGRPAKGEPSHWPGMNSRLDSIQAAVLLYKLPLLPDLVVERNRIAARYQRLLSGCELDWQQVPAEVSPSFQHIVARLPGVAGPLVRHVNERGVGAVTHYCPPIHRQPAFADRVRLAGELTVTEHIAPRAVSLPVFNGMTEDEIEYVAAAVRAAIEAGTMEQPG